MLAISITLQLLIKTKLFTPYIFYVYLELESDGSEFITKEHVLVKGVQGLGQWK